MRKLTGTELSVIETLLADIDDGIQAVEPILGPGDPAVIQVQAARSWLRGVRDSGMLVKEAEPAGHGTAVLEGFRFPVQKVTILGGKIVITATRPGPNPELHGPLTIFGADDCGFAQGDHGYCPATTEGQEAVLVVNLDVRVTSRF